MKTLLAIAALSVAGLTLRAEEPPRLSPLAAGVLKLGRAHIGENVIEAYIKSVPAQRGLSADEIVYLRKEGISEPVLETMLRQSAAPGVATAATSAPSPADAPQLAPMVTTNYTPVAAAPAPVTYVGAPATVYAAPPVYAPAPVYVYEPSVSYYVDPFYPVYFGFGYRRGYSYPYYPRYGGYHYAGHYYGHGPAAHVSVGFTHIGVGGGYARGGFGHSVGRGFGGRGRR